MAIAAPLLLDVLHRVITQELQVAKLARGSRTELLELLQYLYKYLLSELAREL